MEDQIINYINGDYKTQSQSTISIYDIGFTRGYGVFDFLRTYNRKPFLFHEHIRRLFKSAELAGINHPYKLEDIKLIFDKLLELNKGHELTFRVILTAGESDDSMNVVDGQPNLYIVVKKLVEPAQELYTKGVKLLIDNYLRQSQQVKSLDYINLISKRKLKSDNGAFTLLYVYEDKVLEAAISNVFIIKDNVVITPKNRVLIGTTRNKLIELIKDKYTVEERDISFDEFKKANEVLITGTTQGVLPVVKVDDLTFSGGLPGPKTLEFITIFNRYVDEISR